jgi:hypothetical protein
VHPSVTLGEFRTWLTEVLGDAEYVSVELADVLKHWRAKPTDRFSKDDARALGDLCEKLGFAIEPDVRLGAPLPSTVIFVVRPSTDELVITDDQPLRCLVTLLATVMRAHGELTADESTWLRSFARDWSSHLDAGTQRRNAAFVEWLVREAPSVTADEVHHPQGNA